MIRRSIRETFLAMEALAAEIVADAEPTAREFDDFYAMLLAHGVRPLGF